MFSAVWSMPIAMVCNSVLVLGGLVDGIILYHILCASDRKTAIPVPDGYTYEGMLSCKHLQPTIT